MSPTTVFHNVDRLADTACVCMRHLGDFGVCYHVAPRIHKIAVCRTFWFDTLCAVTPNIQSHRDSESKKVEAVIIMLWKITE